MNEAARIGILGGTLDPIHQGHLDAALAAREALGLDRVLIVPAAIPPHRSAPSSSAFHRFAMAALATSGLDGFEVSDVELTAPVPSYTFDTLTRIREHYGVTPLQIFFIIGTDAFAEIETWHRYPAVLDLANFVVISRPGSSLTSLRQRLPHLKARMRLPLVSTLRDATETLILLVDAPTMDVSSTEIRRRIVAGEQLAGMVTPTVENHIRRHSLYRRNEHPVNTGSSRAGAEHLHGQD